MREIIRLVEGIITLPGLFVQGLYVAIGTSLFHQEEDLVGKLPNTNSWLLDGSLWLALGGLLLYQNMFNYVTYVYACPDSGGGKCYRARADISLGYCDGSGQSGESTCSEDVVEAIYFLNGGHIEFSYCHQSDKKFTCYEDNKNYTSWEIEIVEVVKVRKQANE